MLNEHFAFLVWLKKKTLFFLFFSFFRTCGSKVELCIARPTVCRMVRRAFRVVHVDLEKNLCFCRFGGTRSLQLTFTLFDLRLNCVICPSKPPRLEIDPSRCPVSLLEMSARIKSATQIPGRSWEFPLSGAVGMWSTAQLIMASDWVAEAEIRLLHGNYMENGEPDI